MNKNVKGCFFLSDPCAAAKGAIAQPATAGHLIFLQCRHKRLENPNIFRRD